MSGTNDLDLMLSSAIVSDEANEKAEENKNKLIISEGVNAKINLYAELTSRIIHSEMECYGYLLRRKWSTSDVITDVLFADDQVVTGAHVTVTDEGVRKAIEEADEMDCEIVGWWHSHGGMGVFHSGTDDANFRQVLEGVAPNTLYRYQDAQYIVDEENKRVVFENYTLQDLTTEQLAMFKANQINSKRKVKQDPFAYSMVVNLNHERYVEKLTKTYNTETKEFDLNPETHPRLEVVPVENDLEFLVADVEWEVRQRVIHNGYGESDICHTDDHIECLGELTEEFITQLKRYVRYRGQHSGAALALMFNEEIFKDKCGVYEALSAFEELDKDTKEKNGYTLKEKNNHSEIKERLMGNLEELKAEDYSIWGKKVNLFARQRILTRKFMTEFCSAGKKYSNGERREKLTKIFEKYHKIASALNRGFEIADKAMKALTYYAMETSTDYNNSKNHKYRNLIGGILTKISGDNLMTFESAMKAVLSSPHEYSRKNIFIWEDRFGICNQLLIDAYNLKIGSLYKKPELAEERKRIVQFLKDFAKYYVESPEKIDELIEKELLGRSGVNERKYSKYQDAAPRAAYIQRQGRPKYSVLDTYAPEGRSYVRRVYTSDEPIQTTVVSHKKLGKKRKKGKVKPWTWLDRFCGY